MIFDVEHFLAFASKIKIPSKEGGEDAEGKHVQLIPFVPLPTQLYFLEKLSYALNEKKIHFFVVLKCRQSGLTTLGLLLDIYWCFMHNGIMLPFIADIAETTNYNRSLARDFVESLQAYPEWRHEIKDDNEEIMAFSNGSKILWKVANKRKKGGIGRSIGAAAAHGTELGSWEDDEGAKSLLSSLAETNPDALYLWEGTASGPGFFQDLCMSAMGDGNTTEEFVFIGWWQHPWYCFYPEKNEEHKIRHAVYWESNPVLNREEQVWVDAVRRIYKYQVKPEQISWWRWHLKQRKNANLDMMYQEYPPLPEYGWRYGARGLISPLKIIERQSIIQETKYPERKFFRFDLGACNVFEDCKFVQVDPTHSYFDLITWEEPQLEDPNYRVVIGADPVHGADEQSNDAAIEVFFAYDDCLVQAAEFTRNELPAYALAWAILHLAGWYQGRPLLCLELAGGGFEAQNEIRRLQNGQAWGYNKVLEKAFAGLEHYIWTRGDARRPVSGQSYHYKTTEETKEMLLHAIQHHFERGLMDVRSKALLKEMGSAQWTKEGKLETPRPNDKLMAAGFAVMAYQQVLQTDLGGTGFTRAKWIENKRLSKAQTQEEFLKVMLSNWVDKKIMEQQQLQNGELTEAELLKQHKDDIADQTPWLRLNR